MCFKSVLYKILQIVLIIGWYVQVKGLFLYKGLALLRCGVCCWLHCCVLLRHCFWKTFFLELNVILRQNPAILFYMSPIKGYQPLSPPLECPHKWKGLQNWVSFSLALNSNLDKYFQEVIIHLTSTSISFIYFQETFRILGRWDEEEYEQSRRLQVTLVLTKMMLLAPVYYRTQMSCLLWMFEHLSTTFMPVGLSCCFVLGRNKEKQVEMHICLMHVYVCMDMHVCLPTPPTNRLQMPEGQTSRHCCSLLGVSVALTELADRSKPCPQMSWS